MPKIDPVRLQLAVTLMSDTLASLGDPPPVNGLDETSRRAWRLWWDAANATLAQQVKALGGKLDGVNGPGGVRIALAGVTSTCTHGSKGAVQNWLAAARRKLEALDRASAA